jgi:hypothetical protein
MEERKMSITRQNKTNFIVHANAYIDAVRADAFIKEQLQAVGYDETRLNEGSALQSKTQESRERQLVLMDRAKSLNARLKETFDTELTLYLGDVRLLRSSFIRDIPLKKRLGLIGERKRSIAGYLEQARVFYNVILDEPNILSRVEKFNFTAETIQAKLDRVEQVEQAFMAYKETSKEAQDATDQCDKDFKKLQDWIRELQDACRIVLKDKPQLMEKVGILVRSSKPAKKKQEQEEPEVPEESENRGEPDLQIENILTD